MTTTKATRPGNRKSLELVSNLISFLLHPLFMPTLLTIALCYLHRSGFAGISGGQKWIWIANVALNTIFFPALAVILMKFLGFISSIKMPDKKDRIIPLMASMIFYFWVYQIFKNIDAPLVLRVLLLGNFWGIILVFLINIFMKVSMHTAAAGSMIGIGLVLMFHGQFNFLIPLMIALVLAGLIGSARLFLKAHSGKEVWLGYLVGIVVQVGAFLFLR